MEEFIKIAYDMYINCYKLYMIVYSLLKSSFTLLYLLLKK